MGMLTPSAREKRRETPNRTDTQMTNQTTENTSPAEMNMAGLARLDSLTAGYTGFDTFHEMIDAEGGYFPTLRCESARQESDRTELTELANAYDAHQEARGDSRRAHRC